MPQDADLTIVNAQLRLTLIAMLEVMGEGPFDEILRKLFIQYRSDKLPPDNLQPGITAADYAKLMAMIEKTYRGGGVDILQRIGKAYFHSFLREQPALNNIARTTLSFWSEDRIVQFVLESLVEMMNQLNPHNDLRVDKESQLFIVIDHNCLVCYQQKADNSACHFTVGLIEEAVEWGTGKRYEVVESKCIAKGDNFCRFSISRE
jgi:predicted hydrocarbon binding protein